jgi:hypothetical protein
VTPISYFQDVWARCDELKGLHAYLDKNLTPALSPDELLRSEWVARVSALDLYIHELVAQGLLSIFEGRRSICPGYYKFSCSTETIMRIRNATSGSEASSAFNLDVRSKLSRITYQYPNDIADGIRLISPIELWNEIALRRGANQADMSKAAKAIKTDLSLVAERRNKIAHEGDLQPGAPRTPWPISRTDVDFASGLIEGIVNDINALV